MEYIDFVSPLHKKTDRDYKKRVVDHDKAKCAEVAIRYGEQYWDGDRKYGYGGYVYDGRWLPVAENIAEHYDLPTDARILDVGCGKAYLLYEFTRVLPNSEVHGIDISEYAIENAKPEIQDNLKVGRARDLPYDDDAFDLVISLNTLHNLYLPDLWSAIEEIERVGRDAKWLNVEAYRDEQEKVNLMYWQLTCRQFNTPEEWEWILNKAGYTGDYGCIYFE